MSKELDNAFVDIRNAYRLIARYQSRVLNIVNYIKEQTPYTDMWGSKWFSLPIGKKKNSPASDYANLSVFPKMWSWDFTYGYLFEYYFGESKISRRRIDMSILQVSDDGFFVSQHSKPSQTDVSTFREAAESNSYLIFMAGDGLWFNMEGCTDYEQSLAKFLSSPKDTWVNEADKGKFFVVKRYPMQKFATQQEADAVIRDFGKLIADISGIRLFKDSYYI